MPQDPLAVDAHGSVLFTVLRATARCSGEGWRVEKEEARRVDHDIWLENEVCLPMFDHSPCVPAAAVTRRFITLCRHFKLGNDVLAYYASTSRVLPKVCHAVLCRVHVLGSILPALIVAKCIDACVCGWLVTLELGASLTRCGACLAQMNCFQHAGHHPAEQLA